jgi:hypothetical protein
MRFQHRRNFKHGHTHPQTKEFKAWAAMKGRIFNPNHRGFHNYGGRGIRMHPEWVRSFAVFLQDIGRAPSEAHFIDRIDRDGDYEPGNVRWTLRSLARPHDSTSMGSLESAGGLQ